MIGKVRMVRKVEVLPYHPGWLVSDPAVAAREKPVLGFYLIAKRYFVPRCA